MHQLQSRPRVFGIMVLTIFLTIGPSLNSSIASASTSENAAGSQDCYIPPSEPLVLRLRQGTTTTVSCINGEVRVSTTQSRKIHARSGGEIDEETFRVYEDGQQTDGSEDNGPGCPLNGAQVGCEGAASNGTQATCNIESTTYDNSIFDIRMTWYSLHLGWRWKKNNDDIKALGIKYAEIGYEKKTGWYPTSTGRPELYAKGKNKDNDWIKQGMEGSITFNGLANLYPHEHNIILWVNRQGDCNGEAIVSGVLPQFAYTTKEVWETQYKSDPRP